MLQTLSTFSLVSEDPTPRRKEHRLFHSEPSSATVPTVSHKLPPTSSSSSTTMSPHASSVTINLNTPHPDLDRNEYAAFDSNNINYATNKTPAITNKKQNGLSMHLRSSSITSLPSPTAPSTTPAAVLTHKKAYTNTSTTTTTLTSPESSYSNAYSTNLKSSGKCPPFVQNPFASTTEPFRDFRGPITLHRFVLLAWISSFIIIFLFVQDYFFPPHPDKFVDPSLWFLSNEKTSYILLTPVVFYMLAFYGAILFRYDTELNDVGPTDQKVVWRIVSRGMNQDCLLETIRRVRDEMRRNALFPYLIEIITDGGVFEAPNDPDIVHLKVPIGYETPNGTKFKARALHYSCIASVIPGDAWVCHLDEETRPTPSGVKGIAKFIQEAHENRDYKAIGQGCMLYHRSFRDYPLLTLADMRRTGDDFGHFFLQNYAGVANVGLHGAYIVCRVEEEAKLGFDVGPHGSITEDAWWVFLAMRDGFRLKWIHGFLEEQATESIGDFLKQRRRWMYGLMKVMFMNPAPARYRIVFSMCMAMWIIQPFLTPLQIAYVIALIWYDLGLPYIVRVLTLFNIAMIFYTYVVGWYVSLREGLNIKRWEIPFWSMVLMVIVPCCQVLEVVSLFMAFFASFSKSGRGFHVVSKSLAKVRQQSSLTEALLGKKKAMCEV